MRTYANAFIRLKSSVVLIFVTLQVDVELVLHILGEASILANYKSYSIFFHNEPG